MNTCWRNIARSLIGFFFLGGMIPGTGNAQNVYGSIQEAAKNSREAYRLKIQNKPLDPKQYEKLGELPVLQRLILSHNELDSLPSSISQLNRLTWFSSEGNPLRSLPPGIGKMQALQYLKLKDTELDSLPPSIGNLTNLQQFALTGNRSGNPFRLPGSIRHWRNLEVLMLADVDLQGPPTGLKNLKNLEKLVLAGCGLRSIPSEYGALSNLEYVVLDNNELYTLPRSFFRLKNLEYLSLKDNEFESIPEAIVNLQNLKVLDLRGNYLDDHDISVLKSLLPGCEIRYDGKGKKEGRNSR